MIMMREVQYWWIPPRLRSSVLKANLVRSTIEEKEKQRFEKLDGKEFIPTNTASHEQLLGLSIRHLRFDENPVKELLSIEIE
jgi:hypothetical protein